MIRFCILSYAIITLITSCDNIIVEKKEYITISPEVYQDKLYGFWLAQCIGNWTGLVTEMDKIGNIGDIQTGPFYTRDNWEGVDLPNIWSADKVSDISPYIDFVLIESDSIWGADDDTDIEYMYQHLCFIHNTAVLSPEQIKNGWIKHIKSEEENYLWVSNQRAFDLMNEGLLPPTTGHPNNNEHYAMIDAQLTTEIFGLYAPGRPDIALELSKLPISVSAFGEAAEIANFYVELYSLSALITPTDDVKTSLFNMADLAHQRLSPEKYPAKMYNYVKSLYQLGHTWEDARDSIYYRYQVNQKDGYDITNQNIYCNGCFAAGINYAASLISFFYGEGDLKETIKIGTLTGWDSDNPTATWAGLLGFVIGRKGVEEAFGSNLSNKFNIHRTRQNFPNNGIDTFDEMANVGTTIVGRNVLDILNGKIDKNNHWLIPLKE